MKIRNICISLLIILAMNVSAMTLVDAGMSEDDVSEKIEQTAESIMSLSQKDFLADGKYMTAGNSVSDWLAVSLAFSGKEADYGKYLDDLKAYVTSQYETKGYLNESRATEYHRIALTVLALGGDPTSFGKNKNGEDINLVADGTYEFMGGDPGAQGYNGLAYALLTLDAKDYEIPESAKLSRDELISRLLAAQSEDGSIPLSAGGAGDVSITSMCLQALAPYKERTDVKAYIDSALAWLSEEMSANGTYESYGSENSEAVSQVIMALCALGMDPETEALFIKEGTTLLDGLDKFRLESGLYKHEITESEDNLMSTEQALLALEAVHKLQTKGTAIFDFSDYEFETGSGSKPVILMAVSVVVVIVIAGCVMGRRKGKDK